MTPRSLIIVPERKQALAVELSTKGSSEDPIGLFFASIRVPSGIPTSGMVVEAQSLNKRCIPSRKEYVIGVG